MTQAQTIADLAQGVSTAQVNGGAVSGLKEKIINGRMEVSQYNGTTAVTPSTSNTYPIDRWKTEISVALYSKLSFQQVTDAPTGFRNSLKATVVTQTAPGASDYYAIEQIIEGFNVSDLAFGGASALPVTVSFYAKASVTGTYSISLLNGAQNRLYISTVSLTTSWARYSVLIPGDVTGTWATDNTASLTLRLDLGSGSTYASGTAGAWSATTKWSTSGSVTFVNQTAGSTLNITGVSLKAGDCRNELYNEWRPYPFEEWLCKRYLPVTFEVYLPGQAYSVNTAVFFAKFDVPARISPTGITLSAAVGNYNVTSAGFGSVPCTTISINAATSCGGGLGTVIGSAALVAGNASTMQLGGYKILWTGCEL